jgi:Lrp/AsnC family leucine-responsive transcriptional regulator
MVYNQHLMKKPESQLDEFDIRLLNALQKNSRLTSIELSQVVHLSPTQCQRRLKKLEESGVISNYSAILNREKVGFEIIAIINVSLGKHSHFPGEDFKKLVNAHPEVLECWTMIGEYDFMLKVVAKNLNDLTNFMMKELLDMPIVANIRSNILLQQIKLTSTLPL